MLRKKENKRTNKQTKPPQNKQNQKQTKQKQPKKTRKKSEPYFIHIKKVL